MPTNIRIGASRPSAPVQTYPNTQSGYGPTIASSQGWDPQNPYGFMATRNAKAYPNKAGLANLDYPGKR